MMHSFQADLIRARRRPLASFGIATLCLAITGCAGSNSVSITTSTTAPTQTISVAGQVLGGQQPIDGATIQLYAAGNTGYGSAYAYTTGTSLLGNNIVTTSSSGNFNITGDYTCPSASTLVYIEAIGGAPTAGQAPNPNSILLAALGPCSALASGTHVTLNELTTISTIWALAPFMTGPSSIGTSPANSIGLTNAFAAVNDLVDTSTGSLSGPSLPTGASIPINELNTLADIVASCINSPGGGVAGDGSSCGNLFALALSSNGVEPTDVVTAALNIAHNPSLNVAALNKLASATSPYQPILSSAPAAWTVAIQYTSTAFSTPTGIVADQSGNLWVTNTGNHSVTLLSPTGSVNGTYATGQSGSGAIAIDLAGNAWVASNISGSLLEISPTGAVTTHTGGGLTTTNALAIDGAGDVWATSTNGTLSVFSSSGTPVSNSGYTGGGLSNGQSLAITPQ